MYERWWSDVPPNTSPAACLHVSFRCSKMPVSGFWYSWEAADEPTGPFTPVGDPVRASLDGELEMSLAEPIRSRCFYRLRVSGKAH